MTAPVRVAARMRGIAPFHVMELLARAQRLEAAGRDIIHMEIGEPDFPTPEPIVAAGRRALDRGETKYTPALGLPALREAIAAHYADQHGIVIDPARVIVTPGASGALLLALGVLVDPGSRVLMADPGYPCNRHFVHLFGGVPVPLAVGPEENYQPTAAMLAAAWDGATRAALIASPSNPTGSVVDAAQMAALAAVVERGGGALVVDEIYHGLIYGERPPTALVHSDRVLLVNSFSKYFGMTGWRLGWLIVPEGLERDVEKLAQNAFIAPPTLAQHAALAAFDPATLALLEARRAAFAARRDFLVPALAGLGFGIPHAPQGAFYVYADCSALADDSMALAGRLLEESGVAVTPGIDFGEHLASRHLRFAYTTDVARLEVAVERVGTLLGAG